MKQEHATTFTGDLGDYSIMRSPLDHGAQFAGDTPTEVKGFLQNFGELYTCRVSEVSIKLSAHNGTHADRPSHFMTDELSPDFAVEQYNGECVLIDVSTRIGDDQMVTRSMLEAELDAHHITSGDFTRRILVRTNPGIPYPDSAPSLFPHFSRDAVELFLELGTTMIGIDSLSVDHPSESNLEGSNHGLLYSGHIAIIENIDLRRYTTATGRIFTRFDPLREMPDARGVSDIFFFPQ